MKEVLFVGLDVNMESITIAVADGGGTAPQVVATIPNDTKVLMRHLRRIAAKGTVRCCYEAGPTGFTLYRTLRSEGVDCVVIAPSLTPKQPGDRIKTDRRDAERLARFLRSGDLTEVYVPDADTEAMRDLERAREDAKNAQGVARRQLQKFLLRNGHRYDGKTSWNTIHMDWISSRMFEHEAHNRVFADYVQAVTTANARLERITKDIGELVESWSMKPLVKALQAMRGIQLITAVIVAAEIGDFRRFATAKAFMAYVGLVPSEYSSGESQHRGRITRTGNRHVRTTLVEAAWNNRFRPQVRREIKKRQEGVAPGVCAIAFKAQHRLHSRYQKLTGRGKNSKKTVTAMARELAGFIWAIAREPELLTTN
jgi:transposase